MVDIDEGYETGRASGHDWELWLGDSCERMGEMEADSVGLTVSSPPFASMYVFSDSARDLSNSVDYTDFWTRYGFIIRELLRVTVPGRAAIVHCMNIAVSKTATGGHAKLLDFRGDCIRAYEEAGWEYDHEAVVWKDPAVQRQRTKSHSLIWKTTQRDALDVRPGLPDYLLKFRKPGVDPSPVVADIDVDTWREWASPVWMDVNESRTLNKNLGRGPGDERHISPLQLDFIDRCIRLWSNRGDVVFDPFCGIGSTPYEAVRLGRKGLGIELKRSYWEASVDLMRGLDDRLAERTLFGDD